MAVAVTIAPIQDEEVVDTHIVFTKTMVDVITKIVGTMEDNTKVHVNTALHTTKGVVIIDTREVDNEIRCQSILLFPTSSNDITIDLIVEAMVLM